MPAPQPITFVHGGLDVLGEMALEGGRRRRMERQRAQDLSFLNAEMARRERQNMAEAMFYQEQRRGDQQQRAARDAFALQKAGRRLADRTPTGGGRRAPIQLQGQPPSTDRPFDVPDPFAVETGQATGYVSGPAGRLDVGQRPPERELYGRPLSDEEVGSPALSGVPLRVTPEGDIITAATPGGFAGVGRPPAGVTQTVAQQLRTLDAARGQIPQERFEVLEQAVRTGKLTPNQLVNSIEDALPGRPRPPAGRTVKDIEKRIASLQATLATRSDYNDQSGEVRKQLADLIDDEEEALETRRLLEINPAHGSSLPGSTSPPPQTEVTQDIVDQFMLKAGGDKQQAAQLMRAAGYVF